MELVLIMAGDDTSTIDGPSAGEIFTVFLIVLTVLTSLLGLGMSIALGLASIACAILTVNR